MSTPHEIEYTIIWNAKEDSKEEEIASTDENTYTGDYESIGGLLLTGERELKYAQGFKIRYYGDYTLISIENSGDYLLVPENREAPSELPEGIRVIKKPLSKVYLVSTSAMDFVVKCSALDKIRLSGTKESDWFIDEAKEAMSEGKLLYAGKYSAPDYEFILNEGCDLVIENTMIYHEPDVREKLESLGIPVLVETSSYEPHPLGRLEWIKLYGELFDKNEEADSFYENELKALE
ncbi:MAG: ABC transporter substrate-binding protein, partial [Lachnospiraceae bacterium]|nr:ABC transporter substrate-binding protein [Lachnospiraceae bacterium]